MLSWTPGEWSGATKALSLRSRFYGERELLRKKKRQPHVSRPSDVEAGVIGLESR